VRPRSVVTALVLAVLTAPLAVEAQPARAARIGVLSPGFPGPSPLLDAFRQGLRELGYVEDPFVRSLVLDQGRHSGGVYLTDPYWFGIATMGYLKRWQAPDAEHVSVAAPAFDVLAEGTLDGSTATYRVAVRNHGPSAIGPIEVNLEVPDRVSIGHCWLGAEGLGRCTRDGRRLTWIVPVLRGNKGTPGLFGAAIDVSSLGPGVFQATAWVDQPGTLRAAGPARLRSGPWTPTSTCRTGPGSPTATSGPRGSAAAPGTGTA